VIATLVFIPAVGRIISSSCPDYLLIFAVDGERCQGKNHYDWTTFASGRADRSPNPARLLGVHGPAQFAQNAIALEHRIAMQVSEEVTPVHLQA
jgi:hypothetical protein